MKNKHYDVSPDMRKRIKGEMKRNGQKNTDIAEYLMIEPQSFSRILNSKSRIADDYINSLCKLWGVRKNYLLCFDSIRTDEDLFNNECDEQHSRNKALIDLFSLIGYEIDSMRMLIICPADIAAYNANYLFGIISPYVDKESMDNWEQFKNTARNISAFDNEYHVKQWFIISPDIITHIGNMYFSGNISDDNYDFFVENLCTCSKVSKNGIVLGYIERSSLLLIMDIIEKNAGGLFDSLLNNVFYQNGFGIWAESIDTNSCL